MAETFEDIMLRFRDISLKFEKTVVKSLMEIEKKLEIVPDRSDLGDLAELISGTVGEVGERLHLQQTKLLSKSASEGGRKMTRKKYK